MRFLMYRESNSIFVEFALKSNFEEKERGKKEKIVRKNIIIRGVSIRARNSFAHA